MSIIHAIQVFVSINLFIIGASHFLRPAIWVDFFEYLHSKGNVGNIINALLSLSMGSFIISFHFLWQWPNTLVTLYGLLSVCKAALYLIFPTIGLKSIAKVNAETQNKLKWAELVACLLAVFIAVQLYR